MDGLAGFVAEAIAKAVRDAQARKAASGAPPAQGRARGFGQRANVVVPSATAPASRPATTATGAAKAAASAATAAASAATAAAPIRPRVPRPQPPGDVAAVAATLPAALEAFASPSALLGALVAGEALGPPLALREPRF